MAHSVSEWQPAAFVESTSIGFVDLVIPVQELQLDNAQRPETIDASKVFISDASLLPPLLK